MPDLSQLPSLSQFPVDKIASLLELKKIGESIATSSVNYSLYKQLADNNGVACAPEVEFLKDPPSYLASLTIQIGIKAGDSNVAIASDVISKAVLEGDNLSVKQIVADVLEKCNAPADYVRLARAI